MTVRLGRREYCEEVAVLEAAAERRVTMLDGVRVVWRCWGSGEPVVLLHGGTGSWMHWIRNIDSLAEQWSVIVPDFPGFGSSDAPPRPHALDQIADHLASGLGNISGGRPSTLIAFSFGAIVAALLCRKLQPVIKKLVLIGAGGIAPPWHRPALVPVRSLTAPQAIEAAHRENLSRLMIHDPDKIDRLAVHVQAQNVNAARIRSRDLAKPGTLNALLPDVRLPLAAIWGEQDATAAGRLAEREGFLRQVDPQLEFVVIKHAGHWVQYEAYQQANEEIRNLLRYGRGLPNRING